MSSILIALLAGLALSAGYRPGSEPLAQTPFHAAALGIGHRTTVPPQIPSPNGDCVFGNGKTICQYIGEFTHATYHDAVSGCQYGPNGVPGRRTRTFEDTYRVTVTTTTLAHGRSGPVYDSSTSTSETLVSSRVISDVCEPI